MNDKEKIASPEVRDDETLQDLIKDAVIEVVNSFDEMAEADKNYFRAFVRAEAESAFSLLEQLRNVEADPDVTSEINEYVNQVLMTLQDHFSPAEIRSFNSILVGNLIEDHIK